MTININGTTGISGVDGSAGTPAIQGSDTNTGVFFGTNTIDLSTDGTSRLSIGTDGDLNVDSGTLFVDASTNRVGIGNTSPSFTLDIQGTAGTGDFGNGQLLNLSGGTISDADTGVGIGFLRTGSQMAYIQARRENNSNEAAYLAFATQTSAGLHPERIRIDSSGRLLVGLTSNTANTTLALQGSSSDSSGVANLRLLRGAANPTAASKLGNIIFSDGQNQEGVVIEGSCDSNWSSGSSFPSRLIFKITASGSTSPTEQMRINAEGRCFIPGVFNFTSGVSANVAVDTDGQLRRATSSRKYKTDIETLENSYADALLKCRPVWYRSTADDSVENPHYGYYGFIAEEVAEIDPRLVFWKTSELSYDENGNAVSSPCAPEAEGVQYDRFVPHLLNLIKRQKEQLETQAASIASLEARLTTLEGGN